MMLIITMMFALPVIDADDFAAEAQAQTVIVQGNGVNLRTGPGLNYRVYTQLNKGARLSYISTCGNWYCVNYGGYQLYVSRDFSSLSYNNGGGQSSGYNCIKITGNGVHLRYGPGLGYGIYGKVNKGTRITYLGTVGDWYCVSYNGYRLYVSRDYSALTR